MAAYTIENKKWTQNDLKDYYKTAKTKFNFHFWDDLDIIFNTALKSPGLFPGINGVNTVKDYIERWVKSYYDATLNLQVKE